MAKQQIQGQMDLFEMFGNPLLYATLKEAPAVSLSDRRERVMNKKEDYLKKGKRLLTLAREDFEREFSKFGPDGFEEKIARLNLSVTDDVDTTASKMARVIIRPMLSSMSSFDESESEYVLLKDAIDYDFDIDRVEKNGAEWNIGAVKALRLKYRASSDIIRFTLRENGYPLLKVYGYRSLSHQGKVCRDGMYRDLTVHSDIAIILARLIIYTRFMRAMSDEEDRMLAASVIDGVSLWDMEELFCSRRGGNYIKNDKSIRELLTAPSTKAQVTCSLSKAQRISDAAVDYFFEIFGLERNSYYQNPSCSDRDLNILNRDAYDNDVHPYRYFLHEAIEWAMFMADPVKAWSKGLGRIRYGALVGRIEASRTKIDVDFIPASWGIPCWREKNKGLITTYVDMISVRVFHALYEHDRQLVNMKDFFEKSKRTHARPFQTKKNIPKKVLGEMEESVFNDYFGYVEIDEKCDIEKVREIADEFIAFHDTYLGSFSSEDVQIRFRRLGNYKVGGMYYASLKCLCVDVDSPASMIHEYGHCIDHTQGELSSRASFVPVYREYARALEDILRKEPERYSFFNSKTRKCNKDYYLLLTEVFARCFEMYITRTLKVVNSICKQDSEMSFAYPDDDALMEKISSYFGELFSQYQDAGEKAA